MKTTTAAALALLFLASVVAVPLTHAAPAQANVANKTPAHQSSTMASTVTPNSGTTRLVGVDFVCRDSNGHNDVNSLTVTVYKPDNSTVHVSAGSGTKTSGSGRDATYNYTWNMNHYDPAGTYFVKSVCADRGAASITVWASYTFSSLSALSLNVSTVSMNSTSGGQVSPGANTNSTPAVVQVTNAGNTQMDLQFSGTDLTNSTLSTSITIGNVWYSPNSNMASGTAFTTSAQTDTGFNLAAGAGSVKNAYFSIVVPSGTRAAKYTGSLTIAAVAG